MFSDFRQHVIGVPQLVPSETNNTFDGPARTRTSAARSSPATPPTATRSAPRRYATSRLPPAFMHDGAFTSLEAAIRHHLDVVASARSYDPSAQGLPQDLRQVGPVDPILALLDPLVATPNLLSSTQLDDLIAFVGDGLLDPRATPDNLRHLIPPSVPSGRPVLQFEFTH